MAEEKKPVETRAGMTAGEMRLNLVHLAFGGDERRLEEFCQTIRHAVPEDTAAVVRGSAITGVRWDDGAPFDADGPGTSDLDLTLVGNDVLALYSPIKGFFIPGVHTKPLSDQDPDICPALLPLRRELMRMVGRPVNIQATRDWVMFFREHVMGQAYLTLFGRLEEDPVP